MKHKIRYLNTVYTVTVPEGTKPPYLPSQVSFEPMPQSKIKATKELNLELLTRDKI
jgi:hypothetical protein